MEGLLHEPDMLSEELECIEEELSLRNVQGVMGPMLTLRHSLDKRYISNIIYPEPGLYTYVIPSQSSPGA
jgi:hypothetical protein